LPVAEESLRVFLSQYTVDFKQTIPILRIFDVQKAKHFYCGFLGIHRDSQGFTGIHRGSQGFTGVHRG
jgi:hypothetical protein